MTTRVRFAVAGFALLSLFSGLSPAGEPAGSGTNITVGRYLTVPSKVLGHDRTILVSLPNGYEATERHYPVVYLLDGHIIPRFSELAAVISIQADAGKMPEAIVIGIDTRRDYARNTFPVPVEGWPDSGAADGFLEFIETELIPYVDRHYRTTGYRILFGQSNTGLLAIHALLKASDTFDAYIAASPMLGWCEDFILKRLRAYARQHASLSRQLSIVYGSDDFPDLVVDAIEVFVGELAKHDMAGLAWDASAIENGGHVPLDSARQGLALVFAGWEFPLSSYKEHGLAAVSEHYSGLSRRYRFDVRIPASLLDDLGSDHLQRQQWEEARSVYELWTENHPDSARAYYSLAVALKGLGERELAVRHCRRAVDLSPNFTQAAVLLEKLEREKQKSVP